MFEKLPKRVTVYEVGPRDGLQNEARGLSTDEKVALIEALLAAGVHRIEATSFVSPKWIPTLADADALIPRLPARPGVAYTALVPNEKGFARARDAGLTEVAVFLSSSESHSKKNINKSVAEALETYEGVCRLASAAKVAVRGYVSTVWGCPYEGEVAVEASVRVTKRLLDFGCYQVSLGDTIGVGTPLQTQRILEAMLKDVPAGKLAMHMHDTRGTALANVLVGLEYGITTFDSAVGGTGGCPYAPGAAGNLASEDLVFMLEKMGVETGIDLAKLVEAGELAQRLLGRELPSKYLKAALGEREKQKRKAPGQT